MQHLLFMVWIGFYFNKPVLLLVGVVVMVGTSTRLTAFLFNVFLVKLLGAGGGETRSCPSHNVAMQLDLKLIQLFPLVI